MPGINLNPLEAVKKAGQQIGHAGSAAWNAFANLEAQNEMVNPKPGEGVKERVAAFTPGGSKRLAEQAAKENAAGADTTSSSSGLSGSDLMSVLNSYVNSVLGPEPTPMDPLSLQMMLGQIYQPLTQQADQAAQLAAQGLRQAGQPALANQYLGMAGHVANAYAQQALAFPSAYMLTQATDRAAKAQELRNQLAQSAFGNLGAVASGASGLADQLTQAAGQAQNQQETVG
jgi:hypothetical protein